MHPSQLIDETAQLIAQLLRFEYPADATVSHYFRGNKSLGPRDRATLAEAAYCVLRLKPRFEHFAQSASGAPMRRLALLGLSHATGLPLESATTPAERAWLVAACKAQAVSELPVPLQHCLPTWLANALNAQYGPAYLPLAQSLLQAAPLDLRVNTLKAKRDDVLAALKARGIDAQATAYSPIGIRLSGKPAIQHWPEFEQGMVEVQDEGSQLLALLVDAKRGEMVADFCAGAGGKTLALGAAMRNTGRLYAFDVSAKRLDKLKPRLARSGLSNVHPVAIEHERDQRVKRLAGKMDRVLVDAPCSGLGTLRRNPDLKWRQNPQTIDEMMAKQLAILTAAATLVRPGGKLVYATCSLLAKENQNIVTQFIEAQPNFAPEPLSDWTRKYQIGSSEGEEYQLSLSPALHGTDGFFAVVLSHHL
jgi:16S rRNA (cytosine967-C5)-methyltransferase